MSTQECGIRTVRSGILHTSSVSDYVPGNRRL
jgi:hypothetical protein